MMNNMMNGTHGWMSGGMWLWPVIGVLLVILLVVAILKLTEK
jgi:hypothetical protein